MKVVHQVQNFLSNANVLGVSLLSKKRHVITVQTDCSFEDPETEGEILESVEVSLVTGRGRIPTFPSRRTRWSSRKKESTTNGFIHSLHNACEAGTPNTLCCRDTSSFASRHDGSGSTALESIQDVASMSTSSSTGSCSRVRSGSSNDMSGSGSASTQSSVRKPPRAILARRSPAHATSSDSVVSNIRPFAGSSTEEVQQTCDFVRPGHCDFVEPVYPGRKRDRTSNETRELLRWRQVPPESLLVRSSQNGKNRMKESFVGDLYECLGVDMIESPHRLQKFSTRVVLPEVEEVPNKPRDRWHAPDIFIVTLSIPLEKKKCLTLSFHFGMKAQTREILTQITNDSDSVPGNKDEESLVNAVRLFNSWCGQAPNDPAVQGRFKLIPYVENAEDMGIPGWISRWNGRPTRIKRTGKTGFLYTSEDDLTMDDSVMEMEISIHAFPWITKQAIDYLREKVFPKSLLTFGFLIEAREESDVPEMLIGLAQLGYPRANMAVPSDEFFETS